nr:BX5 [Aphelandra squarrosa]
MEGSLLYTIITAALVIIFVLFLSHRRRSRGYQLPPSPAAALPIIGHLHLLKEPLHQTLQRFSEACGPIFLLRLGVRKVVVVSSPELLEECYTAYDVALSNRPRIMSDKYIGYDHTTMAGAPYGDRWRSLRRLAAQEVLSTARINSFTEIRHDEAKRTLQSMVSRVGESGKLQLSLRPELYDLIFNVIMRMLTGKRYIKGEYLSHDRLADGYREIMSEFFENAQTSNPEDFLPFLKWVDYRGLKKKMASLGGRLDNFYQSLLQEHRQEKRNTIIGHLLSLQESDPQFYDDQLVKGFMTNMIVGSLDTSVVTIEWAMCLLLNNPNIFKTARQELDSQIGLDRLVEEQDLSNLPYLHGIIMETLRMFPPGPLMLPRESSTDCVIGGYDVPNGTIVLVNAYAIQRDPKSWDDPASFKPERFIGKDVELRKMLPFGVGRRSCPGSVLAHRMLGLILGSLIQCFDWERMNSEKVDLTEGAGLTLPKLQPLEAICKPRVSMVKVIQESDNVD